MFSFDSTPRSSAEGDAARFPAFIGEERYRELLAKWGFLQSGEWSLQQYRYTDLQRGRAAHDTDAAVSMQGVSSTPSDTTQALAKCNSQLNGAVPDASTTLSFRPLTCHWTTLAPLRDALVDAKVVRQVQPLSDNAAVHNEHLSGADVRLPIVKCAEELLPHGEVICDELRALFLQAHNRSCVGGYSSGWSAMRSEEDGSDADEGEEEGMWGVMSGAKLPLRQLRGVFDKNARGELLYHLLWRLIAGSGPLNQFEDDAAVYMDVARQLYRSLITSFHVRETAVLAGGAERVEDDVTTLESPNEPLHITRYEAVVDALVYEVFSVPGLRLFPSNDGVVPSNLNFCYVVVNPSEQTVSVWYHHC